ncbi:hypothetical protein GCM10023187_32300 [Nibrella viscosa]|uniref:Ig-like domain-containing protein n=1 Tax=Nibrella viscosa TaxID=1084524 RepID=A0ABP8KLC1_9BACT
MVVFLLVSVCFSLLALAQTSTDAVDTDWATTGNEDGNAVSTADCNAPHPDYQALVDLYNSTNGANWYNNANWLSGCDPCSGGWSGITCTNGRVSLIDLKNNRLSGTLPSSLSALTSLQVLRLFGNDLSGSLPASWSALTNLRDLRAQGNQLSGSLPDSWSALTNLQVLILDNNNLNGSLPASWSALASLQELWLVGNQLSGSLPASWSALTKLQLLRAQSNQLSGSLPTSWSALPNLQQLYLNDNQLSGSLPDSWSALPSLRVLNLFQNQLSGSLPASWSALTSLQVLRLFGNDLNGSLPASWSALPNLQLLRLDDNQLSGSLPDSWSALTTLFDLRLNDNQLSGSLPTSWSALTNLQFLYLFDNQLSGCIPASYSVFCGKLVNFSNNAGLPGGGDFSAFCASGSGSDAISLALPSSSSAVCTGASVTVAVSVTGTAPLSYQWYKNGALVAGQTTATLSLGNVQAADAGSYQLVVTGCSSTTSAAFSLSVNPAPTAGISPSTATLSCTSPNATLTAMGGTSYLWSTGATTDAISATVAGTYSVTVSTGGCTATASATVTGSTIAHPDYQALVDLYNSTNGPNWSTNTNWLSGCDPCSGGWYGITCTDGRVSQIDLNTNRLSGTLPSSLSALTSLQQLRLFGNELSGSLPVSWSALTNLRGLRLDDNQLTESLPVSWSALTNLQELFLCQNQLSGSLPASWSALTKLQRLYLFQNQLGGSLPAGWSALANMQSLLLNDNQLSGCIPASYSVFCGKADVDFSNNAGLPGGGDFSAFCASGSGSDAISLALPSSSSAVCTGASVTVAVSVTGTAPLTYQWYKNGGVVTGQTSATLQLSNVQVADAGSYSVVVAGACNSLTATAFSLTVNPPALATIAASTTALNCTTPTASLSATGMGTYRWSTGETTAAITVSPTSTTAYALTLTTAEGCLATNQIQLTYTPDTQGPTIITTTLSLTLNAQGQATLLPTAIQTSDNCSGEVSVRLGRSSFTCADRDTVPISVTATDASKNSTTATVQVTVLDNTAPTLVTKTVSKTLSTGGTAGITAEEVVSTASDNCSYTLSVAPANFTAAGSYTVVVTATDAAGNSTTATAGVSIGKRQAVLAYQGLNIGQYSDPVALQSLLTEVDGTTPLAGKPVSFTLKAQQTTGTTTAAGVTAPNLVLTQKPDTYTLVAFFAGDAIYLPVSTTAVFSILPEDSRATYTGALFASATSVNAGSAQVTLSSTIQDITAVQPGTDNSPGDIRNATVTFVNRDDDNKVLGTAPVGLVNPGDLKIGTATVTISLPTSNQGYSTYTIGIIVGGYYTRNSPEDNVVVNVATPQNDFISGGGFINLSRSAGQKAGDAGTRNNFGFNVKYNKNATNLQGNVNVITRRMEPDGMLHVYQIKGNTMTSLSTLPTTAGGKAAYNGKASIQDITNPLAVVAVDGNATLQVTMTDNGEPGSSDAIAITVWNKLGGLWFASEWDGVKTLEKTLAGGNLVVRGAKVGTREAAVESMVVATVTEGPVSLAVAVQPNPTTDELQVTITGPASLKTVTLKLYDVLQRIVGEWPVALQEGQGQTSLSLANQATGVYLLSAEADRQRAVQRVLKR